MTLLEAVCIRHVPWSGDVQHKVYLKALDVIQTEVTRIRKREVITQLEAELKKLKESK